MNLKQLKTNKFELWQQIIISLVILVTLTFVTILVIANLDNYYEDMPPPNSTEEWKEILSNESPCKWYNLGCQRLECVIDCSEINSEAGELICVC